jgi:hypothetical protein
MCTFQMYTDRRALSSPYICTDSCGNYQLADSPPAGRVEEVEGPTDHHDHIDRKNG